MAVKRKTKKTRKKAVRRKKTARTKSVRKKTAKTTKRKSAKKKLVKTRKKTKSTKKRKASGLAKLSYTLSDPLAEVCGTKKCSRPQVVKKLWTYIKAKNLQDPKNRRMINPDAKLAAVLGNRPINMLKMAGAISKHLREA